MNTEAECPECGHTLRTWHEGLSAICQCPNCDWEVVTTYSSPIQRDKTDYQILILQNLSPEPIHYKTLSSLTGKNYVELKSMLSDAEFILLKGRATKILPIKKQLEEGEVEFQIVPDFVY